MKKVQVYYQGWGENWLLGTLADNGEKILFEYSAEALRQELELSPRYLSLNPRAYGPFPDYLERLPGLISDALPDGWGMLLMNRLFRQRGIGEHAISSLDRLGFIGHRAMGALSFVPEMLADVEQQWISLQAVAEESQAVLAGEETPVLQQLALLGGSPHGARPKALVYRDAVSGRLSTQRGPATQALLVKFQAKGEAKEVCAIEDIYARLAARCGLDMPATCYFDLGPSLAAFGIQRFDLEDGCRVPIHTLAGLLHADFRLPSVDYTTFLRATRFITKDIREVWKAYERAVFNVLFHNRDDHSKNFSYRLGRDRQWKLAPCYDLTFSEGPGGEHFMDVCGEGKAVTRAHLLNLARQADLDRPAAVRAIDRMLEAVADLPVMAADAAVSRATLAKIVARVDANRERLR